MQRSDLVIVGGGLAAAVTAEQYRKSGGTGTVAIISQDADAPVHRPPLSKEYLRGDEARDKVFVHPADFYRDNDIALHLGQHVEAIDLEAKRLTLRGRDAFGYGRLVLATGARPRRLTVPGAELPGVFYLRSLASAEELIQAAEGAQRVVLVGAGFIGIEVAATLRQRGLAVTVVEMAPRMWARLMPEVTAGAVERYCRDRGVDFRFGRGVQEIQGDDRVEAVLLSDGERLPADVVVAGVGVALNIELAAEAGLPVADGIMVDQLLRTSHSDVHAVGDVACFPDAHAGRIHVEHWDNALHQGQALGKTLAGVPTPFDHVAYFFSDIFDLSINMVGYPLDWDQIIVRGDADGMSFTTLYGKGGRLRAVCMINDDRYFDTWTRLVDAGTPVAGLEHLLADPAVDPAAAELPTVAG